MSTRSLSNMICLSFLLLLAGLRLWTPARSQDRVPHRLAHIVYNIDGGRSLSTCTISADGQLSGDCASLTTGTRAVAFTLGIPVCSFQYTQEPYARADFLPLCTPMTNPLLMGKSSFITTSATQLPYFILNDHGLLAHFEERTVLGTSGLSKGLSRAPGTDTSD